MKCDECGKDESIRAGYWTVIQYNKERMCKACGHSPSGSGVDLHFCSEECLTKHMNERVK